MKKFLAIVNILVLMAVTVYADRGPVSVENEYKQFLNSHHIIIFTSKKHHRNYVKIRSNFLKTEKYPGAPCYAKRQMIEFVDETDSIEATVANENNKLDIAVIPEIRKLEIERSLTGENKYISESFLFNNTNQQRK